MIDLLFDQDHLIVVVAGVEQVGIDDFLLRMNTFRDHFDHDRSTPATTTIK
jgi:hypothetical protein